MNLTSPIGELPFVGPAYQRRLEKLGINSVKELLLHIPHRYLDYSQPAKVGRLKIGETISLTGYIASLTNQYTRSGKNMQIGQFKDTSGQISVVWFNQPYLTHTLYPEIKLSLAGKVDWFSRKPAIISPDFEILKEKGLLIHTKGFVPVYPETYGLSSKWLRTRIFSIIDSSQDFKEYLPKPTLSKYLLTDLSKAVRSVHFPEDLAQADSAKKRLAFEELLALHLSTLKRKHNWRNLSPKLNIKVEPVKINDFIAKLPFKLTVSQKSAIDEILEDFNKGYPMNRLLEGDVGSGKTIVAATAAYCAFLNGYQSVLMAPTQILAQQHYDTLNKLFKKYKIRLGLITSETKNKELHHIDIYVGTHALIYGKINFDNVALAVIDEQHRFGVKQRSLLIKKTKNKIISPHILTMTATPIPRTVALSAYGDLNLSTLNEMPPGRQKIVSWVVSPAKRKAALNWLKDKIVKENIQAFVVCPLIEESQKETMLSVKAASKVYKDLRKNLPEVKIGLLHGKLKANEKDRVLAKFRKGKIDILVSTPVVEVGIDIPNATVMIIEGAERFGLATLHQLRGRVGRGNQKSFCLMLTDSRSPKVITRLKAMESGLSGFELSELDLRLRGPGEIFGTKQHGFPELKIASWQDIELIKSSKSAAEEIYDQPLLYKKVIQNNQFVLAGHKEIV